MATSIFSLFGEIFIDNGPANKGIDETTKKGASMGDKLKSGFATAGKAAMAVGTAAVAAGTAMYGLVESTSEYRQDLAQLEVNAKNAGAGMDGMKNILSSVGAMTGETDAAFEGLNMLLATGMTDNIDALANTLAGAALKFDGLKFEGIAEGLQETLATGAAVGPFGEMLERAGVNLEEFNEGLDGCTTEAEQQSYIMEQLAKTGLADVANGYKEANKDMMAMEDAQFKLNDALAQVATMILPVVAALITAITPLLPELLGALQLFAPILTGLLETVLPMITTLAQQLLPPILNIMQAVMPLFEVIIQTVLPPLLNILTMLLPFMAQIAEQILPVVVELITALLPVLMPIIESILPPLLELLEMLLPPLLQLLEMIIPPLTAVVETLAKVLTGVLGAAFEALRPIVEAITKVFGGLIDFITGVFTGDWEKAWNGIKDIFGGIWEGIKAAFKAPINWIIQGINAFIRGINKIKIPDWVPLVGGKGFSIGEIPLLARGGEVTSSGTAIVGDAGPELVKLNKGAEVIPLRGGQGGANITLHIEHFHNERKQDVKDLVDEVLEIAEEKLRRKEAVFA